ncbi:hypothetical protein VTO42DRAFT_4046 [Malbranchea cinnamomea]
MSTMVQPNLGPPTPKYPKDEPPAVLDDPRQNHSSHPSQSLQNPRTTGILPQPAHPRSPLSSSTGLPHPSYAPSQLLNNGIQFGRPSTYAPQPQEPYGTSHTGAYTLTSAPSQYPSTAAEAPDLMAATAQMNRPYPPIYQTPQSTSPASIASPQTHDQHGRSLYGPPSQIPQGMYGYSQYPPVNSLSSTPYGHAPTPPQPQLTSPSLLVGPSANPHQLPPQHNNQPPPQPHPSTLNTSPRMKLEAPPPPQPTPTQRTGALNPSHPPPPIPTTTSGSTHSNSNSSSTNTTAAPGPIPATTPLVVRQDSNGVQWIAFEYSRDRVKMEYTIRCDVENINIENLSPEFKADNCVYPRACCPKEQYKGNRLVYETECNAVGWALAQLNPCLRGKRGLIQRAVDSWRNSNQDPRLRSRRVRRMAKMNSRKAQQQANQLAGPGGLPPPGLPAAGSVHSSSGLGLGTAQLHHHHAQPDGATGHHGQDDVSGSSEYANGTHRPPTAPPSSYPPPAPAQPPDLRLGHVLHGYPSYAPPHSSMASNHPTGPSMPPTMQDRTFDHLARNSTVATTNKHDQDTNPESSMAALFGNLQEGRRRKFILVEDSQRNSRVRVKVMLDQVDMNEIPDSYRKSNSVFPRTYVPVHGPFDRRRGPGDRESDDDGEFTDATVGRTLVPVPMLEGQGTLAVPKISRSKRKREAVLNDLGYRMSWGQSRVFAGRTIFLQRSLDAYRNKMRSIMIAAGQEVESVAPHFETRIGKRKWLERNKRARSTSAAATTPAARNATVATSASSRDAQEVEP